MQGEGVVRGGESDDEGAVVGAGEDKGFFACYGDTADVTDLAFDGEAVDRLGGEGAVAAVQEDGAEVGVIPSHFDRVLVKISNEQDIGKAVVVCVDHHGVAI